MTERKPHKYADVIKAWADGKTIQGRINLGDWQDAPAHRNPDFVNPRVEWRIKPENIFKTVSVYLVNNQESLGFGYASEHNLRLEFDPDSSKLLRAEVIE